ncbi:MAG: hypothetical protein LIO67_05620 [Lachnospiraceae bacterium]|nr:hypothetical protein [Lachnospiraceae bacterium]
MAYETSVEFIADCAARIERTARLAALGGSGRLTEKETERMLHQAELIVIALRERWKDGRGKRSCGAAQPAGSELVKVDMEDGCLVIRTPELYNRRAEDGWFLKALVRDAVAAYCELYGVPSGLEGRFYLAYVRFVKGETKRIFDNDNTEAHQVGDAVVEALGMDDNPYRVQYLFTTRKSRDYEGCCICLVGEERLPDFLVNTVHFLQNGKSTEIPP